MENNIKELVTEATLKIINKCGSDEKINNLIKKHDEKPHFIPKRYRIFGGLLQSMNIQFGNFIEELMSVLIENEDRYEIISEYSGKKDKKFKLSRTNEERIDAYITNCQASIVDTAKEFPTLMDEILKDKDTNYSLFSHDIDLLFKDKLTNKIYYLEIKYNDDHDTGKFVDINRKFIKTYAYLTKELRITTKDQLTPILFYFTNKRMKGNIYLPEGMNIKRGKAFFDEFLAIVYEEVDNYMKEFSESDGAIEMFDSLYNKIMILGQRKKGN